MLVLAACSRNDAYYLVRATHEGSDDIVLDFHKHNQRIKASCLAKDTNCSNLLLRSGNTVECYLHIAAEKNNVFDENSYYGVKFDAFPDYSGMVCHAGNGRGRLFVMYTQQCVQMKTVASFNGQKFVRVESDAPNPPDTLPADFQGWDQAVAYAPITFSNAQVRSYIETLNGKYARPNGGDSALDQKRKKEKRIKDRDIWDEAAAHMASTPPPTPPATALPLEYDGYTASIQTPLRFCKDMSDRYFDERGREVVDDTVLLKVLESNVENH